MKKLFLLIFVLFIHITSYANQYEFLFCAMQNGNYISTTIRIYSYNTETNSYGSDPIAEGSTFRHVRSSDLDV